MDWGLMGSLSRTVSEGLPGRFQGPQAWAQGPWGVLQDTPSIPFDQKQISLGQETRSTACSTVGVPKTQSFPVPVFHRALGTQVEPHPVRSGTGASRHQLPGIDLHWPKVWTATSGVPD